jgi:hypothetical protein
MDDHTKDSQKSSYTSLITRHTQIIIIIISWNSKQRFIFKFFLSSMWIGDHPQEEWAKCGYRSSGQVDFFQNSPFVLVTSVSKCGDF